MHNAGTHWITFCAVSDLPAIVSCTEGKFGTLLLKIAALFKEIGLQGLINISKGAGYSDEPGQTSKKLSANDTSGCPRLLKTGPHTKKAMGIDRLAFLTMFICPLVFNGH